MSLRCLKVDGAWRCVECHGPVALKHTLGRCRPARTCSACRTALRAWRAQSQMPASIAVQDAIRDGQLTSPSQHKCSDCDKQAAVYDHRDYTKPLEVEPVCRRCNRLRGAADKWLTPRPMLTRPATEAQA